MKKQKQNRPSFLYAVIIFLALVILALGALTLHSLRDLIDLRSKVSGLQTTVQELSDASANLVKQAQELAGLNDQLSNVASDTDATGASDYTNQDSQEEGTLSPSHASSFTDSTDESLDNLLSQLKPLLPQDNGTWSVYVCNLMKNTEGTIDDQQMQAASLIKLYVMGAVMQEIQNGNLEMNDTTKHLLDEMITVSDNSATNELVRYLNKDHDHKKGMKKVNAFIKAQGFEYTHEYNGLEDTSLWYDTDTKNTTSAKDCGRLLERIYRGEFVSHLASRQMEELLLNQQVTYKIPSTIPSESRVANKTGETSDCENDAAIVYTPKGDYILCIMSCEVSSKNSAVDSLQEMSSLIYSYFMNRDTSKLSRQVEATAKETD